MSATVEQLLISAIPIFTVPWLAIAIFEIGAWVIKLATKGR